MSHLALHTLLPQLVSPLPQVEEKRLSTGKRSSSQPVTAEHRILEDDFTRCSKRRKPSGSKRICSHTTLALNTQASGSQLELQSFAYLALDRCISLEGQTLANDWIAGVVCAKKDQVCPRIEEFFEDELAKRCSPVPLAQVGSSIYELTIDDNFIVTHLPCDCQLLRCRGHLLSEYMAASFLAAKLNPVMHHPGSLTVTQRCWLTSNSFGEKTLLIQVEDDSGPSLEGHIPVGLAGTGPSISLTLPTSSLQEPKAHGQHAHLAQPNLPLVGALDEPAHQVQLSTMT